MSDQERLRIEKDAEKYVDQFNHVSCKSACYVAGAIHEHEILKPQLEYADSIIKKLSEALVTRDGNITSNILLEKLKNERNIRVKHEAEIKIIADQAKFWEDAHAHLEEKLRTQYDAELNKERNKAIDECIECLNQQQYALFDRKELESLKK